MLTLANNSLSGRPKGAIYSFTLNQYIIAQTKYLLYKSFLFILGIYHKCSEQPYASGHVYISIMGYMETASLPILQRLYLLMSFLATVPLYCKCHLSLQSKMAFVCMSVK